MFSPVFVVGLARSGTTVVGKVISQHEEFAKYEAETLILSVCKLKYGNIFKPGGKKEKFLHDWFRSRQHRASGLTEKEFLDVLDRSANYADLLINFLRKITYNSNQSRIVDSTPANALHIKEIQRACGTSSFVNVIRDGRDVALSQIKLGWSNPPFPFKSNADHLHYALVKWQRVLKKIEKLQKSSKLLTLKYEEVISNPKAFKSRLEEFLSLREIDCSLISDFEQANSAFDKEGASKSSPVGRWKALDSDTLENICFGITGTLKRYGYEESPVTNSIFLWFRLYYFKAHISLKALARQIPLLSKYTSESIELSN